MLRGQIPDYSLILGEGDIIDEMFDKMLEAEPEWKKAGEGWRDVEVENEWGSVILLARRK